jgi:hypothetical protein
VARAPWEKGTYTTGSQTADTAYNVRQTHLSMRPHRILHGGQTRGGCFSFFETKNGRNDANSAAHMKTSERDSQGRRRGERVGYGGKGSTDVRCEQWGKKRHTSCGDKK